MKLKERLNEFLLAVRDPASAVDWVITTDPDPRQVDRDGFAQMSDLLVNMILSDRELEGSKIERLTQIANEYAGTHKQKSLIEVKWYDSSNVNRGIAYRVRDISKLATTDMAQALSL